MDIHPATRRQRPETSGPCIYCGSTVPPKKREHVMSQAVGTFEQNWTLDCVCDACNQHFGDTFELVLGRDSIEGFLRVEAGVKPPGSLAKFLNRRTVLTVQGQGKFHGMRAVMKEAGDAPSPVPPPQVGFRRSGDDAWQFFLERELTPDLVARFAGPAVQITIVGHHGQDDLSRLLATLAGLGIAFQETERAMDQPFGTESPLNIEHVFNVDDTLRRAAAKIGFNYAAKILGCDIVRRPEFDAIRRFVRHGEEPLQMVSAQDFRVLTGSEAGTSFAHACALEWQASRQELIGIVNLFNRVTYGIRLCSSASDEWVGVSARHVFDPVKRTITALPIAD